MRFQAVSWKVLLAVLPVLWLPGGDRLLLRAETAVEEGAVNCSQFMPPKRSVNGKIAGQEECLMRDRGIVEPSRNYRRIDIGISGTLSGWVVKQGARQNYFTSGPDFTFTQFGNPHSPRNHGILRYESAKGTAVTLYYPETGWNGKVFILVHGRGGSFLRGSMQPWDKYFNSKRPFDANRYEQAMLDKGYAVARSRRNADGFVMGDYSAVLDDGTLWEGLNINMVPELILDKVRLVDNLLKDRLGRKPTRNYWYGHSAGTYTALAFNYITQLNPDLNKDADGTQTISGILGTDPGGGLFLPLLVKDGQDILLRTAEQKARFIKTITTAHQAYPLAYSNVVPGEMDLNYIPEVVSPVALKNKRTMSAMFTKKGVENFRMYEVRGLSHSGGENLPDGRTDDGVQILNMPRLLDGLIDLLDNWVEKGVAPPPSKADAGIGHGNQMNAISMPEVACPLGQYFPFPSLRGMDGVGLTGFAAYDGTSLEPLDGQIMFVDMNSNGVRDRRETLTEAWHRLGLLKPDQSFSRDRYTACVQDAVAGLRKNNLITEKVASLYVEEAKKEVFPPQ
ncbi:MAG: hypothetical protein HYX74_08065 [Acidobacteria bacterium]|nr:hypothetical protein [Acidobacteriota bacterium]